MNKYTYQLNYGTITAPVECFEMCFHQGDCEPDVMYWIDSDQIEWGISDEDIRKDLDESGGWEDEELNDIQANRRRILWITSNHVQDEWRENPWMKPNDLYSNVYSGCSRGQPVIFSLPMPAIYCCHVAEYLHSLLTQVHPLVIINLQKVDIEHTEDDFQVVNIKLSDQEREFLRIEWSEGYLFINYGDDGVIESVSAQSFYE